MEVKSPLFNSSSNQYRIPILYEGEIFDWYATRVRHKEMNYTTEIFTPQAHRLKTSAKRKMKKLVEEAVKELP